MSDEIRDALIRIRYEVQKSKLEGPELSQTVKAHGGTAAAIRETKNATEEAAQSHEEFGRRSFQSFAHAGHGVLQLARGIALMSASSDEDTRKVLENLMKIEAAVSIAKGGENLAKFAGEFGALGIAAGGVGAVIAAGAASWMLYSQQVEKARKEIESLAEAHHKASQAETKMMQERESIKASGAAAQTDANLNPADLKKDQEQELKTIRSKRQESAAEVAINEGARQKAATESEVSRGYANELPESMLQGMLRGYTPAASIDAVHDRERRLKFSDRRGKAAEEFAGREEGGLTQQVQGAERERSILQQQATAQEQEIRNRESIQVKAVQDGMNPTDPRQKANVEGQVARYDVDQSHLAAQAEQTGKVPAGFQYGRSLEESQTSGIHSAADSDVKAVQDKSTEAIKQVSALLTNLNQELSKLKNANPN